jgi:hypothetical protein
MDAMGCQKEIVKKIKERLQLKQDILFAQLSLMQRSFLKQ